MTLRDRVVAEQKLNELKKGLDELEADVSRFIMVMRLVGFFGVCFMLFGILSILSLVVMP